MTEPGYTVGQLATLAKFADECADDTLHRASQEAFELQKRLRGYEKAIDREIRKRDKAKGLL